MTRRKVTDQELLDYSEEHLGYEIERLRATASDLAQAGMSQE
jgi:hypothetical protein